METPTAYHAATLALRADPKRWLVTGAAGFIGSHLVETLLNLGQEVVCLDNYSTGYRENLDTVLAGVRPEETKRCQIMEGDIADYDVCEAVCRDVDLVLHQAALGSVPRSISDPRATHHSNVTGTVNLFSAARENGIRRVVYASSSSVYGDEPSLPKIEERTGTLLSPYAASKAACEIYAEAFSQSYQMEFAGLRYFNVFGPRQSPSGPYAAVIPIWIAAMLRGEPIPVNGDGDTTRDFTYVENVVQANLLAATVPEFSAPSRVFNVAIGGQTSLNDLFRLIRSSLKGLRPELDIPDPVYRDFRPGDIRHSCADFERIHAELGFEPTHSLAEGLELAVDWYLGSALSKS